MDFIQFWIRTRQLRLQDPYKNTRLVSTLKLFQQKSPIWLGFLILWQTILKYVSKQAFSMQSRVFSYIWGKSW